MKKSNKTKLHLQRDVLRVLQAPDLPNVIGGLDAQRPQRPSATTERVGACCA
jgi:hypothetical protein